MKEISNQSIAVFMAIVLLFSLVINYEVLKKSKDLENMPMTGAATQASIQICINREPIVNYSCSSYAYVGTRYSCDVDAGGDIDQNLTFYDNTSLFEINHTNVIINFTPTAADIGVHYINITATDNSTCSNNRNSTTFVLNITSTTPAYCGDGSCNAGETCSACAQDCGICPPGEEKKKGRGAGGGGGGGGAGSALFDIDFTQVESKIVTGYEGDRISFTFNGVTAHWIIITDVKQDSIDVSIPSKSAGSIEMKATGSFDINKDGTDDLSITLLNITQGKAKINVKKLAGADMIAKEDTLPIEINPENIKILIRAGESSTYRLILKNVGEYDFKVILNLSSDISNLARISEYEMMMPAKQNRTIGLLMNISASQRPGVYTGRLIVEGLNKIGESITKYFPVVIEIESPEILFDSSIYIAPEYREMLAGQNMTVQVTFFNLKKIEISNITVDYIIKDMDDQIVSMESEEMSLANQKTVTKTMQVPDYAADGDYAFIVQAKYKDTLSTSSQLFRVVKSEEKRIEEAKQLSQQARNIYVYAILISIVIVVFSASLIIGYAKSKISRFEQEQKDDLKKKIEMLENAYEAEYMKMHGLIESAERGKMKELEDYIHKLLDKGFGKDQIKDHLKKYGWLEEHIEHALSNLRIREIEKEINKLRDSLDK
ncbi:MAG: hypothetical protein NT001_01810 [Candidatus Woesearchaeota archaeon]|nr:hypothetical protein [Candidatus Woesearchaeota archaeon]